MRFVLLETGIRSALNRDGFVLRKEFLPQLSTAEVAVRLGRILELDRLLPSRKIPTVQSLRPRHVEEVGMNQYSGHFGFGLFPLHTDLAHWILPPRYFLLRCLVGADGVLTNLLHSAHVIGLLGTAALHKAVLRARKRHFACSGLVRALSLYGEDQIFRWDPVFLEPLNRHAEALRSAMLGRPPNEAINGVRLQDQGDTLIIDNWRMLHGRSPVPEGGSLRSIERIYLAEVFDDCPADAARVVH
jgi:L-asparagine oxygenase